MKKGYLKLLIFELVMLLVVIYSAFNNISNTVYTVFLFVIFMLLYLFVGFEKENTIHRLDVIRKVFVYTVLYLMIIYIVGFVIGFVRNPYSLELIKMINNILPLLIIIILEELIRYNIAHKSEGNKYLLIMIAVIFTFFDIALGIKLYPLTTGMEIFELIGLLILPSVARNALLTYIAHKGYYRVNIIYRILISLNVYVLPIYPDLGVYLESIFSILLPTVIYVGVSAIFYKQKLTLIRGFDITKKLIILPSLMLLLVTVMLTSGIFKYFAMAVGSGSMEPVISIGDVIIVEKQEEFKIGDILVHQHNGKIILHRIISIEKLDVEKCYQTKGDANETSDDYIIC